VVLLKALVPFAATPPGQRPNTGLQSRVAGGVSDPSVKASQFFDSESLSGKSPAATCFELGKQYFEQRQWERAAEYLEKSLRYQERNDQSHLLLGLVWRELGRPVQAESELLEAARENPTSCVNLYMAGYQLQSEGKYEQALAYHYRAIQLNPRFLRALEALGQLHVILGNDKLAEHYLRKAVEIVAGSSPLPAADADLAYSAYIDLAYVVMCSDQQTRVAEGLKYANRAAELDPTSADAHYLVGKGLFKLGNVPQAIQELGRAERLATDDPKIHLLLARAYDRAGRNREAQAERDTAERVRRRLAQSRFAGDKIAGLIPVK
jgi:tetratricopeptide (TPR) repeat protein